VREINTRLEEMAEQISDSMLRKLRDIHHRVQNDCNQLLTPMSDEQFKWREDIYDAICEHKQKFRAIVDAESKEQTTGWGTGGAGFDGPKDEDFEDIDSLFM
jgi:hypothetical protein